MAEYIEREAAIQNIKTMADTIGFENPAVAIDCAIRSLKNIPAADVSPVVRSEWEILTDDSGNEYMKCKHCDAEFYDGDNDTVDTKHNFCPNCGADMREG